MQVLPWPFVAAPTAEDRVGRCQWNRYYHGQLGRFVARDPIGYKDGYNLFQGMQGNPIIYTDPDGEAVISGTGAGLIAVAWVVLYPCLKQSHDAAHDRFPGSSDKFRHCWASCHIAKKCSAYVSYLGQIAKEGKDAFLIATGLDDDTPWFDIIEDMRANQQCVHWETHIGLLGGWVSALCRESCEDCCRREVGYE